MLIHKIGYLTVVIFLCCVFLYAFFAAMTGSTKARYFLWSWAALLLVTSLFVGKQYTVATEPAVIILVFFLYIIVLGKLKSNEELEVSHEETRRVLSESNRRIDEERRHISHTLHDLVNPNLALCKTELKRLEIMLADNPEAGQRVSNITTLISAAYSTLRDVIKNTRTELIDTIGFTAAIESLVAHYSNVIDKPRINLAHNLPKRPDISQEDSNGAFLIIREAILNAVKHANAQSINIDIRWSSHRRSIYVSVTDDGAGMPVGIKSQSGIGLIDMRERARALGSRLKIVTANRQNNPRRPGTKLSFWFPTQS